MASENAGETSRNTGKAQGFLEWIRYYIEDTKMHHVVRRAPQWKVDAFNRFRYSSDGYVGAIHTPAPDPGSATTTPIMLVLSQKMKELNVKSSEHFSDHPTLNPVFHICWDAGKTYAPVVILLSMMYQTLEALEPFLPQGSITYPGKHPKARLAFNIIHINKLTASLERAFDIAETAHFPSDDAEGKIVFVIVGFERAIDYQTSSLAFSFLLMLEDWLKRSKKGKLVLVGDCEGEFLAKYVSDPGCVVKIYRDDKSEKDQGAWIKRDDALHRTRYSDSG